MTPEETKRYIERRLGELGWNVHIGKAAYDRIFRFTEGTEKTTNALCHKLLSLGALQENREITDEVVSMAMTDLVPMRERSTKNVRRDVPPEIDIASIDQLTAVLERKVANGEIETEVQVQERPRRTGNGVPRAVTASPKVLVVDTSKATYEKYVKALGKDFTLVHATDGEQAWKLLLEQSDIELIISDIKIPALDGHELIKRVRAAVSPPHLVGIPIIIATQAQEANAKLRVLMAGANDFVIKDVDSTELRARVTARHRLHKTAPRAASTSPRQLDVPAVIDGAKTKVSRVARTTTPAHQNASIMPPPAPVPTLTAERRFPEPAAQPTARVRESWLRHLYRVSSTTTITLSATVLLALAIIVILYVGRDAEDPSLLLKRDVPASASRNVPPATANEPVTEAPVPPAELSIDDRAALARIAPSTQVPATKNPVTGGKEASAAPKAESITGANATAANTSTPSAKTPATKTETPPAATEAKSAAPAPPRTATAEPTPREEVATASPAAQVSRISRDELTTFLRRFASVYEAGDLDQFLTLFADNARTNDRTGRRGIREDYDTLFRSTDLRRMKLGEINWEIEANQAYGWGDFEVTVKRSADQESYVYTGSLTFVVEKVDGRLRITRLYHGQQRTESG